ncbi:MAG: hypothetical protein DCC67_02500 [Planctomycetota bacterium]|nr:MAG: hypothetical protein DCC67_02500 [Planctomycetota bacterium]
MEDASPSFDERLQQAKLDAMKELAYGASHEINNPLANISARAQTLLRDEQNPERRRLLEAIHQQALRAHEMISDLMLFARPPQLNRQMTDLPRLVETVLAELQADCAGRDIRLACRVPGDLPTVHGDPIQLAVALKALCQNAIEAAGRDGKVEVTASMAAGAPPAAPALRIDVADDGPGVSPAVRPHLFDPFFSGREAGRGLGFGLSKAWRIVEQHGGRLWLDESGEPGAKFIIELPLSDPPS